MNFLFNLSVSNRLVRNFLTSLRDIITKLSTVCDMRQIRMSCERKTLYVFLLWMLLVRLGKLLIVKGKSSRLSYRDVMILLSRSEIFKSRMSTFCHLHFLFSVQVWRGKYHV